jgi:hypothetical protein
MAAAAAALGAGGLLQYKALDDAQEERKRRLQAALGVDEAYSNKQRGIITGNASNVYTPENRNANLATTEGNIQSELSSYLKKNATPSGVAPVGGDNPSPEFLKASADTALNEGKRSALITSLYSRIMAPGQLRFNEGINNASTASDVDTLAAARAAQARARSYGINAVRPNSLQMLLGQLLMSGSSLGAGGNSVSPSAIPDV